MSDKVRIVPADRLLEVQEYYFSKKLKEIAEMKASGVDIINLGIGSPDLAPDESVIEELREESVSEDNHAYQSYVGIPELRKAFAEWYNNYYNVIIDSNNEILPLMGSKEGIMHVSMAYLNVGDKVLVPNPGYPTYRSVSKLLGAEILEYELSEENDWFPDFKAIEDMGVDDVKIMWVNYPHMPSGKTAQPELFDQLISFGRRNNILICHDNPYSFLGNRKPLSIFSSEKSKDVAIELNSLSKSHNMAGWRIGMVAGDKKHISNILRVKSNMDSGMFYPLQKAAIKALELTDDWYNELNEIYKERKKIVWEIFDLLDCTFSKDQVGLFVWARIPDSYSSASELSDLILNSTGVFITPGFIFGSMGEKYLRISLCAKEEKIKEACNRIKQHLT